DCTFTSNYAFDDGGGIFYEPNNSSIMIADCNFTNNYATFGGALYFDPNCSGTISDTILFTNNADEDGGAIFLTESDMSIIDCNNISYNSAVRGAGLYCTDSPDTEIINCSIKYNEAVRVVIYYEYYLPNPNGPNLPPIPGGGPNDFNSIVVVREDRSGAAQGGGMYSFIGPTLIRDSEISHNTASTSGGGLYFAGGEYDTTRLTNCLITHNSAGRDGAGISNNWQNELAVSHCTIAHNTLTYVVSYGGGLYGSYDSNTVVSDSIIWANTGSKGFQIAVCSGDEPSPLLTSKVKITDSDIGLQTEEIVDLVVADELPVIRPGFDIYSLGQIDDFPSALASLGFTINYFGTTYSTLYVNNNGNVTFDSSLWSFTPFGLTGSLGTSVIAPFFADVDTSIGNPVMYGQGTVDGHNAFAVNWIDVGYFFVNIDKLNTFQLVLIERSDRAPGDFDIELNYETITWETGDASGGFNGYGGFSARAGFSNGTGNPGTFYEFTGSGIPGYFLDSASTGLIHSSRNSLVSGRYIFSVRNGALDIGRWMGIPIYVEDGCTLYGWEPNDPNNPLDPYGTWDPNTRNIADDPNFTTGSLGDYYLSQIAAGQLVDSNCVDAGSGLASDLGMDMYTTRTDIENDEDTVDMGYHYPQKGVKHDLVVTAIGPGVVVADANFIDANNPLHDPSNNVYAYKDYKGRVFVLTAIPDPGYRVLSWTGTDNDPSWNINTNTVTMLSDNKAVVVEFEQDVVTNYYVPSEYATIEEAIVAAHPAGDNVIVARGIHYVTSPDGIDFQGKQITLMSADPDDPYTIANTIIDAAGTRYYPRRAFHFHSGEDANTLVMGLTIRNGFMTGPLGAPGLYSLTPEPYEPVPGDDPPPPRAERGHDAVGDSYGGGILCENASSPTFLNCVITDCVVTGAWGGDGALGLSGGFFYLPPLSTDIQDTPDGQWGGHGGTGIGRGYGGAIACRSGSRPIIRNCTIENNTARGGCGGTGAEGGFPGDGGDESEGGYGGTAIGDGIGGGIYCDGDSTPIITNCIFSNNIATTGLPGDGGVGSVYAYENPLIAALAAGYAGYSIPFGGIAGGAAYFADSTDPNFTNCTFTGNKAREAYMDFDLVYYYYYGHRVFQEGIYVNTFGGALYAEPNSTVTLTNCDFTENLGGAVLVKSDCIVDFNNCLFKDNESTNRISNYGYPFIGYPFIGYPFIGSPFIGTPFIGSSIGYPFGYYPYSYLFGYAYYDPNGPGFPPIDAGGGAVYIGPDCNAVNIRYCEFQGNSTYYDGGAIDVESNANIAYSSFGGNISGNNGGAIDGSYQDSNDPNITSTLTFNFASCSFVGNQASQGLDGLGGALYLMDFVGTLNDCHFIDNTAKNGGGLYLIEGTVNVTGSNISGNRATGCSGIDAVTIPPSYFGVIEPTNKNICIDIGGGLVCANTNATIQDSTLSNNIAEGINGAGGAINFYGGYLSHLVRNCLITGNSAALEGGAISANFFATPKIENSTFSRNSAGKFGGAIFCDWSSDPTIIDCIFDNCNSHAIGEEDIGNAIVGYSLFHNNSDGDYGIYDPCAGQTYTYTGPDLDSNNIVGNPIFVTGLFSNYYLDQSASSAVGNGSDSAVNLGLHTYTTDPNGGLDIGQVDIGYHYYDPCTLQQYTLMVSATDGHGAFKVVPSSNPNAVRTTFAETYYASTPVTLITVPNPGYRTIWSGTDNDASKGNTTVVMWSDKDVTVRFDQPRTIVVGSDPNYTTIQHAIDAASDGDVVIIPTGTYDVAYAQISIINKTITLTSTNPDDPAGVAATVLEGYFFDIDNAGPGTIIDGVTIRFGRMYIYNSSPIIRNCVFDRCRIWGANGGNFGNIPDDGQNGVSVQGGAIAMYYNSSPTIQNCDFINCSVTGGDGGPGDNGVDPDHIYGFDGGWAGWGYGGAVYCGSRSSPTFEQCSFTNCYAMGGNGGPGGDGAGGARGGRGGNWQWSETYETGPFTWPNWYWWDGWQYGDYDIDGSFRSYTLDDYGYFKDYWKYSGYGGAIYCENESSPKFLDCTFTNNNTYGGVSGVGGTWGARPNRPLNIENFGGAVYASYWSNPEFTNCSFNNNSADTSVVAIPDDIIVSYGGAIAFEENCEPKFTNCNIENSQACIGGGMYWSNSSPTIIDCSFSYNTAYHGAGLYSVEATGTITSSIITGNQAFVGPYPAPTDPNLAAQIPVIFGEGGGYYCLSSIVDIIDSVFTGNRASASGGAVYFGGSDQDTYFDPILHNCLLTYNSAGRDGGAISANWFAEPIISNCTIADNSVRGLLAYGGGLYCSYESNVEVINSIIWGNQSSHEGSQVALTTGAEFEPRPASLTISHSDIEPAPDEPNELELTALDLVILMDTTGSMWGQIDAAKASATQLVNFVAATMPDYRIAVADYRDFNDPNYGLSTDYPYQTLVEFTNDTAAIVSGINLLNAPLGAGGDWLESVYAGLMHCIDHDSLATTLAGNLYGADPTSTGPGPWRPGPEVSRVIILIADAPPHAPEPFTGYTLYDIAAAATTGPAPIRIIPIVTGFGVGNPMVESYLNGLAAGTGGVMLQAIDPAELFDAIMQAIYLVSRVGPMIYVEDGCILDGWDWNPDTNSWDPNAASYNIAEDPLFVAGYYLSHTATGQLVDSPCIDAGSADANDPDIGLDTRTTRTDGVNDVNVVDMGYHYNQGLTEYHLTVSVVDANGIVVDPNLALGYVEPNSAVVYEGFGSNVITLTAYPDLGYKVKKWTGTNDDTSTSRYNTVTMTEDKYVTIEFERAPLYNLSLYVINRGYGLNGTLEPNTPWIDFDPNLYDPNFGVFGVYSYYAGTDVVLNARPDPNYEVRSWFGTDDDSSEGLTNIVTMDSNNVFVAVEFGRIGYNIINLYDENMVLDSRSPFPTIQSAVNAAGNNYTVELTQGLYSGLGNYNVNLRAGLDPNQVRQITVRSTDPTDANIVANTIIDCGGLGRAFIFDSGEDPNYIVSGLTIMNGFADNGGAMLIDGASPSIRNCIIVDNFAVGNGGAIYITNGSPIIVNTQISRNIAGGFGGGIYAQAGSVPEIINCLITSNSSDDIGGAMYLYNSDAIIRLSTIAYNYGLALEEDNFGQPIPIGGIAARDSSPDISHCIIGLNGGYFYMPGDYLYGYWGSTFYAGDDIYGFDGGVTYSDIEEGDLGEATNISEDPLWISGGLGPFYLSQVQSGQPQTSPCVNAGEQYILQDLQTTYNLGNITTSIMNYTDVGYADMGYHYPFFTGPPIQYSLVVEVVGHGRLEYTYYDYTDINDYDVNTVVGPNESPAFAYITPGTSVQLRAIPDPNYRVLRWTGTNDDTFFGLTNSVTMYGGRYVRLEFERAVKRVLDVSTDGQYTYLGIQNAIDDAREGDVVLLHSGTYAGTGIEVIGKNITITGTNPDDPDVVASTIIDCTDELNGGIHILGTPGGTSVLSGVTIMNSHFTPRTPYPSDDAGDPGMDGADNIPYVYAYDMYGTGVFDMRYVYVESNAAITVIGNHIITNCIIRDCSVTGGNAIYGNAGNAEYMDGGNGGNGGSAGGAGIYIGDIFDYYYEYVYIYDPNDPNRLIDIDSEQHMISWGSSPLIKNCIIDNCVAIAGNGANGGTSGARATGGTGGLAGRALGAGIFCDVNTSPRIENCTITNCRAVGGNAGDGGDGDAGYGFGGFGGLSYADPLQPDPENFSAYGAGVYCGIGCEPNFINCTISDNITDGSVSGIGGLNMPSYRRQQPRRNYDIPSYGAGLYCDSGSSP
ncbi:MAG: right-handed parallel beta-helix repeat-containing protein, partial [Planctomycetota bacterium]